MWFDGKSFKVTHQANIVPMARSEEALDALRTLLSDGTETNRIVVGRLFAVSNEEDAVVVCADTADGCAEREQRGENELGGEHDAFAFVFGRERGGDTTM